MEVSDIVLMLDKKYAKSPVPCMNEGLEVKIGGKITDRHGALTVNKSGSYLVCGVCGYQANVDRSED